MPPLCAVTQWSTRSPKSKCFIYLLWHYDITTLYLRTISVPPLCHILTFHFYTGIVPIGFTHFLFILPLPLLFSSSPRHGLTSADILDTTKSAGEMAVRLAVAEVQVVTENKDFLAQHGVDIDALESTHSANRAVARSTTTLLVKNLPATTVPDEIESMFARYGSIAG